MWVMGHLLTSTGIQDRSSEKIQDRSSEKIFRKNLPKNLPEKSSKKIFRKIFQKIFRKNSAKIFENSSKLSPKLSGQLAGPRLCPNSHQGDSTELIRIGNGLRKLVCMISDVGPRIYVFPGNDRAKP